MGELEAQEEAILYGTRAFKEEIISQDWGRLCRSRFGPVI